MEVTANWLDAESVKPPPGRIVCVMDRDGCVRYGWTVKWVSEEDEKEELEWKAPDTHCFVSAHSFLDRPCFVAEPVWWISLYELKRTADWRPVESKAVHYIGPSGAPWTERVIAWGAGLEGMPAEGAQVLVKLGTIGNFRWYGTGVARLARVGYSDQEGYEGFLTFILEEPSDGNFDFSDSVKEWAYLPEVEFPRWLFFCVTDEEGCSD